MDRPRSASRGSHPRLPRPRGDGPSSRATDQCRFTAPPPTRGWTLHGLHRVVRVDGSPAHAGMDRSSPARHRACWRLPRPRGDGPSVTASSSGSRMAPPPTRGWTLEVHESAADAQGSPAHAGMDLTRCCSSSGARGLPRPRGDGPVIRADGRNVIQAPPPTRGWTRVRGPDDGLDDGSPAHAGMDRTTSSSSRSRRRLPRPRGDGPRIRKCARSMAGAPPPTRGWTPDRDPLEPPVLGSPAHAGMDLSRAPPPWR